MVKLAIAVIVGFIIGAGWMHFRMLPPPSGEQVNTPSPGTVA